MQILKERFHLDEFWKGLQQADESLLLLDFDGTLSPFVDTPEDARLYPQVESLLQQLIALPNNRLVIVSGREINSLSTCLGLCYLPELWGCHGWQRRFPGGGTTQRQLAVDAAKLLGLAEKQVRDAGFGGQLEIKPVSLALHWRGIDPEVAALMREQVGKRWRQLEGQAGLQLKNFSGGFELCGSEVNKATAIAQLLSEAKSRTPIAYLGDDQTDEDAFNALSGRGLNVLVRSSYRDTAADLWLQPPEELLWFLRQWLECRGGLLG